MANYHFDATAFGNPSYSAQQKPGKQFIQGVGDVGRGQYRDYNPTAPFNTSIRWEWDGATLAAFRNEWESNTKLNRGADWFTIDLPLMLRHGGEADTMLYPYSSQADFIFAVLIAENGGSYGFRTDFFGSSLYGDLTARTIFGKNIQSIHIGTGDFMNFNWNNGEALPGVPNAANLEMEMLDTGEIIPLTWNGTSVYTRNMSPYAPIALADWKASAGQTRLVSVRPYVQQFQRYNAHFTGPFQSSMVGYDRWDVSAELEIDVTEKVVDS